MAKKIDIAIKRLNEILPLKERQENISSQIKLLYQHILKSFVSTGRILRKEEMRIYVNDVDEAIKVLVENEMIIISTNGEAVGAYPFTMEDREYKVHVNGFEINTMCAIDALAISIMYDVNTQISSRCRITDVPIYLEQSGTQILNFDEISDTRICVAWEATEKDLKCANSLCMEMFFVSSSEISSTWQYNEFKKREVFTLDEAMGFSRRFIVALVSL